MGQFDNILAQVMDEILTYDFPDIIKAARLAIKLPQKAAAEHLHIKVPRLKNLERGMFTLMPDRWELRAFSDLYNIPIDVLHRKAKEYARGEG